MLDELFSYDPSTIGPKYREQMAAILKAKGEILALSSEVTSLRARSWAGEEGLTDLIDLKAADLLKLRVDHADLVGPFVKDATDLDALKTLLPMIAMGVMHTFKIPLPIIVEAIGFDVDQFKMLAEAIKELVEEVKNA